jgi:hypothetical protein
MMQVFDLASFFISCYTLDKHDLMAGGLFCPQKSSSFHTPMPFGRYPGPMMAL